MLLRDRMSALKRPRDLPSGTPSRAERRTLRCDRQMDSSPTPPFPKSEKSPRNSVPSTMTCWTFCSPTRSRTVRMPLGSTLSKSMRSSIHDNAECGTKPRGAKRTSRDAGKKRATTRCTAASFGDVVRLDRRTQNAGEDGSRVRSRRRNSTARHGSQQRRTRCSGALSLRKVVYRLA